MAKKQGYIEEFLGSLEDSEGVPAPELAAGGSAAVRERKKVSVPLLIIGVIGELLICAGSFLGLFVVWQVWWTNMEMSGKADAEVVAAQEVYGEVDTEKIGTPQQGDPPLVDADVPAGETIGIMHIPRLAAKATTVIRQSEALSVLNQGGYGHYIDTAMPGEKGNFSTAIHRDSYGSRVLHIDQLRVGDPIIVETDAAWYVYEFTDSEIVAPTDVYVVSADPYAAKAAPDPNNAATVAAQRYLTITTCHPPFVSNMRWIVHAKFDHWVARGDGIPEELADNQEKATKVEATGSTIRDAVNDAVANLRESLVPAESEATPDPAVSEDSAADPKEV